MSKILLNDGVKERSSSIIIREESDFIQQCKITKIELSDDANYLLIEVQNKGGMTCESRYYLPVDRGDEKKYEIAQSIYLRNMKNIVSRYVKNINIEANNYPELTEKVIATIKPHLNKSIYVLFELVKNDKGIFTRIAGIAPFADTADELFVSKRQKDLLKEKNGASQEADSDEKFLTTKSEEKDLPF